MSKLEIKKLTVLKNNSNSLNKKVSRSLKILPNFVGSIYLIHNGKDLKELLVTKDMVGHKFGEFSSTRAKYIFKKKKQKSKKAKWAKK